MVSSTHVASSAESTETPPYPAQRARWSAVLILMLLYVLAMLDRSLLSILVGPVKKSLDLSDVQISLLLGFSFALFYSLIALPIGSALDRYSRRTVIFLCVATWSIGTVSCGLATGFIGLFLARMSVGAGEAGISPGAGAILADSFPPTKLALPLSVFSLGNKLGQSISLFLGGALVALIPPSDNFLLPYLHRAFTGWQLIFMIVGLPGVLIGLLVFAMPEPVRRVPHGASGRHGYGEYVTFMLRHIRLMIPLIIGSSLYLAVALAVTAWGPAHFQRTFGWSAAQSGAALGTALLIGPLLGLPLHGWLADRWFRRGCLDAHMRYLALTALIGTPVGIAAFVVPSGWASVALIGLLFFVITIYVAFPMVVLQVIVPGQSRAKAGAVHVLIVGLAGGTLGPLWVAMMTDFVFRDPAMLHWSIASTIGLLLPAIAISYAVGCKPFRLAVAEARQAAPII